MEIAAKNIVSDEKLCILKGCILNIVNHLQPSNRWKLQRCCPRAGVGVAVVGTTEQKNQCLSTRAFSKSSSPLNSEQPIIPIITLMLLMLHTAMMTNDACLNLNAVAVTSHRTE